MESRHAEPIAHPVGGPGSGAGRPAVVVAGTLLAAGGLWWAGSGPAGQMPVWTILPGWSYQLDGLSLAAATLGLLVAGGGLAATLPALAASPLRLRRRSAVGWLVLLAGLAQTALAGTTLGRWLGLEVAGLALALLDWPDIGLALRNTGSPFWRRVLAGVPLLVVGAAGLLDTPHLPGQPVAALTPAVVAALLVPAVLRALYRPGEMMPAAAFATAALYGPAAAYPLLRSLAAGPWDPWARLLVAGTGLTLLAWEVLSVVARHYRPAPPPLLFRIPDLTFHVLGATLLGLGIGTPAAVAGGLVLAAAGWLGGALARLAAGIPGPDGAALRLAGRLGAWWLPPLYGFAGLWLLGSAALSARYGLGLVLLLGVPALYAGQLARPGAEGGALAGSRLRSVWPALLAGLPPALLLLLGGLDPAPWLQNVLQPALAPLAAGVPALPLTALVVPGVGYQVGDDPARLIATWPALGVAVGLALAWLIIELLGLLVQALSHRRPGT